MHDVRDELAWILEEIEWLDNEIVAIGSEIHQAEIGQIPFVFDLDDLQDEHCALIERRDELSERAEGLRLAILAEVR